MGLYSLTRDCVDSGPRIASVESEPLGHQGSPERVLFGEEHVLKLTLVKSAQLCKYAKNHGIIQITRIVLYVNSISIAYLNMCVYIYIYLLSTYCVPGKLGAHEWIKVNTVLHYIQSDGEASHYTNPTHLFHKGSV